MSDAESSPIDAKAWSSLETIADGDAEFMVSLIEQYLEDSALLISQMAPSLAENSAEGLERSTHTLKSASANLGAMVLTRLCEELCAIARSGSLDDAHPLVPKAEAEYERAKAELEARLEKLGAA